MGSSLSSGVGSVYIGLGPEVMARISCSFWASTLALSIMLSKSSEDGAKAATGLLGRSCTEYGRYDVSCA